MGNKSKFAKLNDLLLSVMEWLLYMFAYTIVFLFVDYLFDTFIIDETHLYIYSFIAVIIIYILNKTVKPILFFFTLPITGVTMGLFYFVNNMIILKLVQFIMNSKVEFTSLPILFFISIILSVLNLLIESVIIKPFIKKVKSYE